MSGITSGYNPNLVKTALDKLFYPKFKDVSGPQTADVTTDALFHQDTATNSAVISEIISDGGQWTQRASELEDLTEASVISGHNKARTIVNFAQSLPVPKHFEDDEMWGAVGRSVKAMAQKGRLTDRISGFGIYRNAFTTTTTNAGVALISDSHTNLNGDTVDNKLTAQLAEASINDAIVALGQQKDQKGDIVGSEARTLLVPTALFKKACEEIDAKLVDADNTPNVYSSKYNIRVLQTPHIGAAAGGSDTAWFLLSDTHDIYRWVRQAPQTYYTPFSYSKNLVSYYKAEFRNVYGAVSYQGIIGSDGSV